MITAERLRELLHYDAETGVFKRLVRVAKRVQVGDIAGCPNGDGYLDIGIDGHLYKAHRLAWLYTTGEWPRDQIDHINGNPSDNRLVNLRPATGSQNSMNMCANSRNTSGFKGVHWHNRTSKWHARISVNGKRIHLGLFAHRHLAYAAYCLAARKHHGNFVRVYEADQLIIPRKVFEERVLRNLLIATQPNYARAA